MAALDDMLELVTAAAADCLDGITAAGPRLVDRMDQLESAAGKGYGLPGWIESAAGDIAAGVDMVEPGEGLEYRLFIRPGGRLELSTGDGQYDTDHSGCCGCGYAAADDSAGDIADGLLEALGEAIGDILAGCG